MGKKNWNSYVNGTQPFSGSDSNKQKWDLFYTNYMIWLQDWKFGRKFISGWFLFGDIYLSFYYVTYVRYLQVTSTFSINKSDRIGMTYFADLMTNNYILSLFLFICSWSELFGIVYRLSDTYMHEGGLYPTLDFFYLLNKWIHSYGIPKPMIDSNRRICKPRRSSNNFLKIVQYNNFKRLIVSTSSITFASLCKNTWMVL